MSTESEEKLDRLTKWIEQKRAAIKRELEGQHSSDLQSFLLTYDQALEAVTNQINGGSHEESDYHIREG